MTHVQTVLRHGSKIFYVLMAAALAFTLTSNAAEANHTPANKVTAAGGTEEVVFLNEGQTAPILTTKLRTSKPSELLLNVALECSIITQVTTQENETAQTARGALRTWITIATEGGATRVVGVQETATPSTLGKPADDGKVTFCDREHTQELKDSADSDGSLRTYLRTKHANAFNWLALNVGSGVHTVTLHAEYTKQATTGTNVSKGAIGRRTLVIEPVRAVNDANTVTDLNVPG